MDTPSLGDVTPGDVASVLLRDDSGDRFTREPPGLGVLFEAMVEAVDVTAMQRGAERWAG
jgi:hypothetical protein